MAILKEFLKEIIIYNLLLEKEFEDHYIGTCFPFKRTGFDFVFCSRKNNEKTAFCLISDEDEISSNFLLKKISWAAKKFQCFYIISPKQLDLLNHLKSNDLFGLITYDRFFKIKIKTIAPKLIQQDQPFNEGFPARAWALWAGATIEDIYLFLKFINKNIKRKFTREKLYHEFQSSYPEIFKRLIKPNEKFSFIDYLNLWRNSQLTKLGKILLNIAEDQGYNSIEFQDALAVVILEEGGHFTLLKNIYEIQSLKFFSRKGNYDIINKQFIQNSSELFSTDKRIARKLLEVNSDEWLSVIAANLFYRNYGQNIQQLLEEMNLYFPTFYQKMKTGFIIGSFVPQKGFIINWPRIIQLLKNRKYLLKTS